jgi:hemolysin-activating ACP:hemolysin acyltransferase
MVDLRAKSRAGDPRLVTGLPRELAFARAVAHLMSKPAFAGAPFGHIARCLAGQVNRGHYAFAARGDAVVGFAGWGRVTEPLAEAWLQGDRGFSDAEAAAGDCIVLNFWQADTPDISRFLVARLTALQPARRLYAKRHYPDGRIRPLRLALRPLTAGRSPAIPGPMPRKEVRSAGQSIA